MPTQLDSLAPAGLAITNGGASAGANFAQQLPQQLLVAQEVNLGLVRELLPPQEHMGLNFAPWLSVPTDDVVFDYIKDSSTGLAPARAEDAESALWTDDEFYSGRGSASVIDWALKNHYTASDVSRFRELRRVAELTNGTNGAFPLTVDSVLTDFRSRVARHTAQRRRRLDNRIEWMIMSALSTGHIVYDDGRIKFDVNFQRPSGQQNQPPQSGTYASDTHDPLNDFLDVKQKVYGPTGVEIVAAVCSRKFLNTLWKSSKFKVLSGFPSASISSAELPYALKGWGPQAAIDTIESETGIKLIVNDNVLRTRPNGSLTFTNTRYVPENQVIFLPNTADISQYDDTELGFGRTLTSPHPAGNWATGFYAWEKEFGVDPWGVDVGTGVKAFPVFPHMELTYTMQVTLP